MRFMLRIYVGHTILSSTKRTRTENKSEGLEGLLLGSRRENSHHTFQRSSAHFAGIVRSRIYCKESKSFRAKSRRESGGAELSGPGKEDDGDTFRPPRATLFFFQIKL
jgi:hypothetical protein